MSIKITNPGALSTIQDLGRMGYQKQGFSVGGAMDRRALVAGNYLTGNPAGEAAVEMTMNGITAIFKQSCVIAVTGADCTPLINNRPIPMNTAYPVQNGQILRCPQMVNGCRSYLTVRGGFEIPLVMGSASTDLKCKIGGYYGRKLEKGDVLTLKKTILSLPNMGKRAYTYVPYHQDLTVRVVLGPQDSAFTEQATELFLTQPFKIRSDSDRMGMRLEGVALPCKNSYDIISDGTAFGSVQITASGQPIILLADRQTTGGYAKIATVVTVDLPLLAQAKPGHQVRFLAVSIEEAQRLYLEQKMDEKVFKRSFEL